MNFRRIATASAMAVGILLACSALVYGLMQHETESRQEATIHQLEEPEEFAVADPTPDPAPDIEAVPARTLMAPAVDLDMPLVVLGRGADGNLQIPPADEAAVFNESAPLDSPVGSTLIAGHVVDGAGRFAPMSQIAQLRPGNRVITTDDAGQRQDWIVTGAEVLDRIGLPEQLWTPDGDRRLVLVTCAGEIDQSIGAVLEYTQNLVVTAVPAI